MNSLTKINTSKSFKIHGFTLGLIILPAQIIIVREVLGVFGGNELIIGFVMANWLIITGLGSYTFGYIKNKNFRSKLLAYSQLLLGILPVFTIFIIKYIPSLLFSEGSNPELLQVFYLSFIFFFPLCFVSGGIFTLLSGYYSNIFSKNKISKVYIYESVGSIIGGLIFNLMILLFLSDAYILSLLFALNVPILILFIRKELNQNHRIIIGVLLFLSLFALIFFLTKINQQTNLEKCEIVVDKNTPLGRYTISNCKNEYKFYENGVYIFSTGNRLYNEESVHFAMLQHKKPKKILLISGGIDGMIDEILKYEVDKIDYIETNKYLIELAKNYIGFKPHPKVNIINKDARHYLTNTTSVYDVVLVNSPPPTTIGLNRLYTKEFYRNLKNSLSDSGYIAVSLPNISEKIESVEAKTHLILQTTLLQVFANIKVFRGNKIYYIASDHPISSNVGDLINNKNIDNTYISKYKTNNAATVNVKPLLKEHSEYEGLINNDFDPILYFWELKYQLGYLSYNFSFAFIGILLIFLIFVFRKKSISLGVFTAGFTSFSLQIIIMVLYQIVFGYIFFAVGVFFTLFMLGLVLGANFATRFFKKIKKKHFIFAQISLSGISLLLIVFFRYLFDISAFLLHISLYSLLFFVAICVGYIFKSATNLIKKDVSKLASELYTADLFGSALGALTVSGFLIPLLGFTSVCILLFLLNIANAGYVFLKK